MSKQDQKPPQSSSFFNIPVFRMLGSFVDDLLTLRTSSCDYKESEFDAYKLLHSQLLLENFFKIALPGIFAVTVQRMLEPKTQTD